MTILLAFLQQHWPAFIGLFGAAGLVTKFLLRDKEIETVRSRTIFIWDRLDDLRNRWTANIPRKAIARNTFTAIGFIVLILFTFMTEFGDERSEVGRWIYYSDVSAGEILLFLLILFILIIFSMLCTFPFFSGAEN